MPSTYEHTTKFKADISSLKSGISQANKELKKIASEYKAASSQADLMGNKQQSLKAKLEYLTKTLEQQKNKLESYKKQLETTKNYTDELRKKEDELSKKLDEAKNKFGANSSEVQKYQKELTQVQKEITSNENQMDKLNVTINNQQAIVNNAQKELNDYNKELQELEDSSQQANQGANDLGNGLEGMEGAITAASTALNGIGEVVDGLTEKFENLLIDGINATISGLKTLAENAFSSGMDFETSMSQVIATMGLDKASEDYEKLSEAAKYYGSTTKYTAAQAGEALNYLSLAGYKTNDAITLLPTILDLASAGGMELAQASDMVTDAMSAMGLKMEDAQRFTDEMATAAQNSNTSVSQLGGAILTIGATARNMKGGTTELSTALGVLANAGIKAEEGGTHLRNMLLSLESPTDDAAAWMDKLGVSVYDAEGNLNGINDIFMQFSNSMSDFTQQQKDEVMSTIFNTRDLASAGYLLSACGDEFTNLQNKISDCEGAAGSMADTMNDNLQGSMYSLQSAWEGLGIAMYEKFEEPARSVVDSVVNAIRGLIDEFNTNEGISKAIDTISNSMTKFADSLPQLIDDNLPTLEACFLGIAKIVATIIDYLPVLVENCLPKLLDLIQNIVSKLPDFMENVFPKIIDCIGFLIENLPTIIGILYTLKGIIATLKGILAALGLSALISKLGALGGSGGAIAGVGGSLTGLLSIIGGGILIIANIIAYVYLGIKAFDNMKKSLNKFKNDNTFENLKEKFNTFKDNVINKLGELKESISTWFSDRKEDITTWFNDRVQDVVDFFTNLPEKIEYGFGYIIGAVAAHLVNMANDVKQWFSDRLEDAQQFFNELPQKIETFLFTTIPEKWNSFKETSKQNIKDFFEDKKTKIQEFIDGIPGMWEDFKTKCKTKWEEFVNGVVEKWNSFWNDANQKKDDFVGIFENIDLYSIGKNIIDGLKNGIEEKWNSLKSTIGNIASGIKDGFQNNLDIHSPSRWMRDFIGKNLMEGLSIGIEDNASSVLGSLKNLSNNIKTSIDTNALSDIQMGLIGASNNIKGHTNSVVNTSTSNVTYTPTFNYNKPLNSKEIYRQNKNMLNAVLGI